MRGQYLGVSHAIGVGSGSDALKLLLEALGVGPDTEVVTPAFSFVASATAALQVGARPVFVDVEPATLTLDPDRVAAAMTPRTRAILAVHLYGLPAAMGPLRALADAQGVPLLEDAAQAFGATLGGRHVGGHGRAAAFSFYPTKNLGAYGDAGPRDDDRRGRSPPHLRLVAEPRRDAEVQPRQARVDRPAGRAAGGDPAGEAPAPAGVDPGAPGPRRALQRRARRTAPRPARRAARRDARVPPVHDPHAPPGRPRRSIWRPPGSAPPATTPCPSRRSRCSASWATTRPPSRRRGLPRGRCSRCPASPSSGPTRSMP